MKSISKQIKENITSHLLFLYLGFFLAIQIFIWFPATTAKKIEPANFTAFASCTSLFLVILGLAKVNEWLIVKKSEKAFERTAQFLEHVYASFQLTEQLKKNIEGINPKVINHNFNILDLYLDEAKSNWKLVKEARLSGKTIKDSLKVWSVEFHKSDEYETLIEQQRKFTIKCNTIIIAASVDGIKGNQDKMDYLQKQIAGLEARYTNYNDARKVFESIPYNELFNIIK
ncbi:hypothetical protein IFU33_12590 [Pantoea agglomerans]|uniref:hypothetical protein n=1 Tax=Enterobacter agglomerans TaxID=549 RepID=UPI00178067A0|nr:hypothetical protein [Pantoea agglomerans]WVJ45258.1 hypothetical protein IFU33_12590 [Pantoea agglomerans]